MADRLKRWTIQGGAAQYLDVIGKSHASKVVFRPNVGDPVHPDPTRWLFVCYINGTTPTDAQVCLVGYANAFTVEAESGVLIRQLNFNVYYNGALINLGVPWINLDVWTPVP